MKIIQLMDVSSSSQFLYSIITETGPMGTLPIIFTFYLYYLYILKIYFYYFIIKYLEDNLSYYPLS